MSHQNTMMSVVSGVNNNGSADGVGDSHDINQPRHPCPCCKYDCGDTNCIQCDHCNNWFHQECAKISDKRFHTLSTSTSHTFKCKFCASKKHKKCSECAISFSNVRLNKDLYCISCKDWFCHDCLSLPPDLLEKLLTTDLPYFCKECSLNFYCPICADLCRDKCIYCNCCDRFLHVKCAKRPRGHVRGQNINYICQLCIKDSLPITAVSTVDTVKNTNLQKKQFCPPDIGLVSDDGCGLCVECNNDCLVCDVCPDLHRICGICLSCKNYDVNSLNQLLNIIQRDKNIVVMHVNAASLPCNFGELENLVIRSTVLPDVIAISETRLNNEHNLNLIQIPGYHKFIYKLSNSKNSDYGGVGMYISNRLQYNERPDLDFNFEGCETKFIELPTKKRDTQSIIIGVIYRHPHDNHDLFYAFLSKALEGIASKYSVILCGDTNIDISPNINTSVVKDYKNLVQSFGCNNLINKYTRIATDINGLTSKTTIDHIITNVNVNDTKSGVLYYKVSDHLPIFSAIGLNTERQMPQNRLKRTYNNEGKNIFLEYMSESAQHMSNDGALFENPERGLNVLIEKIQTAEERAFPLKRHSRKQQKRFRHSWMTLGILKSMEHRDRLFREQLGKNDANLSRIYRRKRNQVTRIIEKAKDLDFFNSFQNIIDNPKKLWAKINSKLLNKKCTGNALPSEIQIGPETIKDKSVIANKLNEQFVNKGHILASELPVSETPVTDSMKSPKNGQTIKKWRHVVEKEILDIISKFILVHKSSGHDNIPAVLIKWSCKIIAPILVRLFNCFLDQGIYPDVLKIAKVTALHKGGDKSNVDHYRSISVLSHINKIFEKLIHARLNDFVNKYNILENNQFGFRKGHSTSHGITHLHETIIQNIEKKKVCVALFIDLKSAFDTIDPQILVTKLHHYGIQGNALQILSSYLTNRKQLIKSDGVVSELLNVVCGVPQGSVLGPLLFILYINDINRCCELDALLFADDAVLTLSHESLKVLQNRFNKEVTRLHQWFITNKLTLNHKKNKFMLFSKLKKKNKEKKFKININKFGI